MDDCFPPPLPRAHALFDALLNEHLDLRLYATAARVDIADRPLYEKMRRAGVKSIQFGCESGTQSTLDFYHKKTTVEQIRQAVTLSHHMGFITIGSFIFGAPNETIDQMNTTLKFARSLPFDSVSFLPLRYMAGSDLWHQAVNQGKIAPNEWIVLADKNHGLSRYSAQQLLQHCQSAQFSFYLRPKYASHLFKATLQRGDSSFLRSFLKTLH